MHGVVVEYDDDDDGNCAVAAVVLVVEANEQDSQGQKQEIVASAREPHPRCHAVTEYSQMHMISLHSRAMFDRVWSIAMQPLWTRFMKEGKTGQIFQI